MTEENTILTMEEEAARHYLDGRLKESGDSLFAWRYNDGLTLKCHMAKGGRSISWFAWDDDDRGGEITKSEAINIVARWNGG